MKIQDRPATQDCHQRSTRSLGLNWISETYSDSPVLGRQGWLSEDGSECSQRRFFDLSETILIRATQPTPGPNSGSAPPEMRFWGGSDGSRV